uniref:Uncharacterized protein n=1 Tax=Anguilla anguilla TaxID=7936 RepID=A0A0E9QCI5_ANGAN
MWAARTRSGPCGDTTSKIRRVGWPQGVLQMYMLVPVQVIVFQHRLLWLQVSQHELSKTQKWS